MPNRVIKESLCSSEKIASLTDFEFRLWVGLIISVDDAGRGDARPAIIKGRVFPLRDRVATKDIESALHGLAAKGCVSLYTVGGKPYFWFPTWSNHQRIRDVKPKYPGPEEADVFGQSAADCGNLPQIAADCGLNPIQYNPNPNPNPNTSKERAARFTPPTLEEVQAYVSERHSPVVAQEFIDFYAAKGWMVGKTPMKDWKAACRNAEKWDRWDKPAGTDKAAGFKPGKKPVPEQDQRALESMERLRREMQRYKNEQ